MKAIQVTHYADKGNIAFAHDVEKPTLDPRSNDIVVKVLAAALNTGDCHLMSGGISLFMKPKKFPYTAGMDVCGIVEEVGAKCTTFSKGDRVVVVLGPLPPFGGLAEYMMCDAKCATLAPENLTPLQAASLPIAGTTAVQAVMDAKIGEGSKVAVLGGSGGVGSLVVQLVKAKGASFIAVTSTNESLVKSLGADMVIDYRKSNWWDVLAGKELDAVIDCVGCDDSWANCTKALARRGRYIGVSESPESRIRTVGEFLHFAGKILGRVLNPFSSTYRLVSSFPMGDEVKVVMDLAKEGEIKPVLEPGSPFEFSLAGAEKAVALQRSHRAKGKIVFHISD